MRRWLAAALVLACLGARPALADGTPGVGVPRVLALPASGRYLITLSVYPQTPRIGRIAVLLVGVEHADSGRPFRGGLELILRQPEAGARRVPLQRVAPGEYQGQYLAQGRPGTAGVSLELFPAAGGPVRVRGSFPQEGWDLPPWAGATVAGLTAAMLAGWVLRHRRERSRGA